MGNRPAAYSHLIDIDPVTRVVSIFRIFPDNKEKQFYNSVELPQGSIEGDRERFDRFARLLGENILLDSPQAREALGV
jgi:hypothetical protein